MEVGNSLPCLLSDRPELQSMSCLCQSYLQSGTPATRGQSRPVHRLPAPQKLGDIHPTVLLSAVPVLGLVVALSSGPQALLLHEVIRGYSSWLLRVSQNVAPTSFVYIFCLSILSGTNRNFNSGQWLSMAFENNSSEINIFQM